MISVALQISCKATVEIHHNKHLKKHVDNLNKTLEDYLKYQCWSLKELIKNSYLLPYKTQNDILNNAGGVFNHNFYFLGMTPDSTHAPKHHLLSAINCQFGSFDKFKGLFRETALKVFGSGYAVLAVDKSGKLKIATLPNQCTVLSNDLCPVIMIDVWEHAYYLKYQNMRAQYIENWLNVINWDYAEKCYLTR